VTTIPTRPAIPPASSTDSPEWWKHPFRIFQTNIREVDSGMDVRQVVQDILDFGCNTWLLNAGGIVSHYPSTLDHQHPSPWLKDRSSGDLLGDALEEAHKHGIRVIARCDFSKLHRDQFERHPDWFYVSPTGQRQVYEGLWSACPSGPYYQEKSLEVIAEILDGYPVDAFFFNWFNMSLRDYSGTYHGICQCLNCKRRFAAFSGGLPLPKEESYADPSYPAWRRYTYELLDEIAGRVRHLIKSRRPDVALLLSYNPDISFHEINNAVERPLPLWRYHAGEAAKTSANAHWERPVAINAVMFWDLPYRYNAEQPGLTELVLAQVIANGANPYSYVLGHTRNQPDRKNYPAVRRMMQFHKANEGWYDGIRSAAEVLLVNPAQAQEAYGDDASAKAQAAFRGAYRALVENHLPFDVLPDNRLEAADAAGRLTRYKAIVLPNAAALSDAQAALLDRFVENGGGVVGTFETGAYDAEGKPRAEGALALRSLGAARILARRDGFRELRGAYLRVTRREDLPTMPDTDFVAVDRAFLYVEPRDGAELSFAFLGPTPYGPPEKCWWPPSLETDHPGLLWHTHGKGRTAYFPWPVDTLFYGHSLEESRALLGHAVCTVLGGPAQVQVETDLPPQVEVTVHTQPSSGATLVHLVNSSGHQDRSFHPAQPFFDHSVTVRTGHAVSSVRSAALDRELEIEPVDGGVKVQLPRLDLLDLLVIR
jgi:hypothetical protein